MDGFPSGQRGQTVNLLQIASVVRIHLHPLLIRHIYKLIEYNVISLKINIAGWSSLEARRAHNPKVIGSNPVPATESLLAQRLYAQIAQLVEQRTENPRVTGSIPVLGIYIAKYDLIGHAGNININGILAQSVEHLTFNQVVRGSNPRCLIKFFGSTIYGTSVFLYINSKDVDLKRGSNENHIDC